MKKLLLATTIIAGFTATATAADLRSAPAPVASLAPTAMNWTGFYVGAHAGWIGSNHFNVIGQFPGGTDGFTMSYTRSGFNGGLYAGYNFQIQQVVLGLEGDIGFGPGATVGRHSINSFTAGAAPLQVNYRDGLNWNGHLRARAGLALGQFMPYVAAGLALAEQRGGSIVAPGTAFGATVVSTRSVSRSGYSLGVGGEFMFSRNILGRIEYIYDDFGSISVASNPDPASSIPQSTTRSRVTTNTVRAGLAYRF